jgi:hypothetical protein
MSSCRFRCEAKDATGALSQSWAANQPFAVEFGGVEWSGGLVQHWS